MEQFPRGLKEEKPARLTYHDFRKASSYRDLQDILTAKGQAPPTLKDLECKVQKDWLAARLDYEFVSEKNNLPNNPRVDIVQKDGVQYTLIGFQHSFNLPQEQRRAIHSIIDNEVNNNDAVFMYEQNTNFPLFKFSGYGIPDHRYASKKSLFTLGYKVGLLAPLVLPLGILAKGIRQIPSVKEEYQKGFRKDADLRLSKPGYLYAEEYNKTGKDEILKEIYSKESLQKANLTSLGSVLKRSAYQAATIEHYKPSKNKVVVMGDSHRSHIKHFLTHGIRNQKITQQAIEDIHADPLKRLYTRGSPQMIELGSVMAGLTTDYLAIKGAVELWQYFF